jgi:hypothetical protein
MSARLFCLSLVLATVAGCGRSSLFGSSNEDCPPAMLRPDGTCSSVGGPVDLGGDLGDMTQVCPGEKQCATDCSQAGCCACNACTFNFVCINVDMGGDGGDAGDPCADKNNCKLPICVGDPRCHVLGTEICNNGIDDNDDGLIDCKDPQCVNFPGCKMHMCNDAMPDCTDPACEMNPKCKDLKCHPTVDFGTLMPKGSTSTRMENTTGTTDVSVTQCAPGGAGMVVGKFTLTDKSDVTLSFTQGKGEDHVFGVFQAGINQACGANPVGCYDPKGATSGSHAFTGLAGGDYYVISQPFEPAGQGPVTVTLSTPTMKEICNNGIDDNGNGLIDCADSDCLTDPNCINTQCKPDFNLGALVVNTAGKSVSFTTTGATADNNVNCQAAKGAGDVVVRFTLKETAGILVDWNQNGDHVFALFHTPGPGQKCDADPVGVGNCFDPSGQPGGQVAWGEYPPGDYLFIFKGIKPGSDGHMDVTISAYRNRKIELCHNGIDDDGNGLIDCADPACIGVSGCSAPYCMPDKQLGNMNVGDSQSVTLNVQQNGVLGYKTSCAKGGGKGMVVQFTVPTQGQQGGIGIGFDCTQTGDHVIALDAAGGPRDACDVNELVCADPKTLPFGCGYEVPNLQAGTYNVIVEGFTAGSEGTMDLTLSIVDDRQLEICNNGIDDDHNGLTDCADRKCVASQFCTQAQCRPDAMIDPMPLTGTNVFKLVQTSGNGQHGQVPCATTVGGEAAVVEITLTATADLKMSWNQIGNHDFALFTDEGTGLPCDTGTLTGTCVKSSSMPAGMTSFSKVPQGKYYLIIQADDAMSAGSVNIAISGLPSP